MKDADPLPLFIHPAVRTVVRRIEHDLIGGAADMARESARALATAARETTAADAAVFREEIDTGLAAVLAVTPSIAPVTRMLHLVGREIDDTGETQLTALQARVVGAAEDFIRWLDDALARTAALGASMLSDGDVLFTYSISSTVFRMIEAARAQAKRIHLVTTESRPGNEGLTTIPRMASAGVHVTIGIDAALGQLMRECSVAIVGADTVTAGGAALCKVGAFPAALVARYYGIPFRVAADTSKFDPGTQQGLPLQIREMPPTDIVKEPVQPLLAVRNPVFEVVPAALITEIITEEGVLHPGGVSTLMRDLPQSAAVTRRLLSRGPIQPKLITFAGGKEDS